MGLTVKQPQAHTGATVEHEDTGLTVFQSNPLGSLNEEPETDFLPYARIPWPIERMKVDDGKGGKIDATGLFVVAGGGTVVPVSSPMVITVLAGRGGTRERVINAEGKPRNVRSFAQSKKAEMIAFHAKQTERIELKEKDAKGAPAVCLGNMYLVAILTAGGGCTVAILDAFKSQMGYWSEPMASALVKDGKGVNIAIHDHSVNETKVMKGEGTYFDPRKFTQWGQVVLTSEQKALIKAACKEHESAISAWLSK